MTSNRPATGRHAAAGKCVYCNDRNAVTRDHVIARQFFPNPRPSNLPTVPSCGVCNASYRTAEEYLSTLFIGHASAVGSNPKADRLAREELLQRLDKRPKLTEFMLHHLRPVQSLGIEAPPGIIHGLVIDQKRADVVLTKITKGLLYYHRSVVLPEGYGVKTWFDTNEEIFFERFAKPFLERKVSPERLGDGVFSYAHLDVGGAPAMTAWLFSFYDAVFAASFTAPTFRIAAARRSARVRKRRRTKQASLLRGVAAHLALRRRSRWG